MKIAIIAGEESGDQLGAHFMDAMAREVGDVIFIGVGGQRMMDRGLTSFFPMDDVSVMGLLAITRQLPVIIRRIYQCVAETLEAEPDLLVIIDSPGFTHSVAKRVAKKRPDLPIVDYVSPSVWAWKPWRARQMLAYVDHVLALLPFEPAVFEKLGGPPCTYVGHPLIESLDRMRPAPGERPPLAEHPTLVVLPGSRMTEIRRLMEPFGETVELLAGQIEDLRVLLPAVSHLEDEIRQRSQSWTVKPEIITGEAGKFSAFRQSHAALAASGTVTLELALSDVPMVVAYRVELLGRMLKRFLNVQSIVLANLVIGENIVPEFLDQDGSAEVLAREVLQLISDTSARQAQIEGLARAAEVMELDEGETPSAKAVHIALAVLREGSRRT